MRNPALQRAAQCSPARGGAQSMLTAAGAQPRPVRLRPAPSRLRPPSNTDLTSVCPTTAPKCPPSHFGCRRTCTRSPMEEGGGRCKQGSSAANQEPENVLFLLTGWNSCSAAASMPTWPRPRGLVQQQPPPSCGQLHDTKPRRVCSLGASEVLHHCKFTVRLCHCRSPRRSILLRCRWQGQVARKWKQKVNDSLIACLLHPKSFAAKLLHTRPPEPASAAA
ncbi:hypothetical protein B0T11DRAFT_99635 [Plectosphaerella cucumerina]|uniref:Uncharacterized protein n=1 Tax=Plectosphaerella cucumerina TaxID=40658 RepID=A0A8K0X2T1_9PEZI|nr:hypothetical protein B0T11DRAFT_99635 [Plectosphaerella cucumerina]